VQDVQVDEERLDVVVCRKYAAPVSIEPRYPGVEIHALMHTLRDALRESCGN
jgi:hypothetical protein